MKKRDLALMLDGLCRTHNLPPPIVDAKATGLKFAEKEGRAFRFDAAWPTFKLAVEIHGGEWSGGRHATGAGLSADCVKARHAVLLGWRVLTFVGSELNESPTMVAACIRAAIDDDSPSLIAEACAAMLIHESIRRQRSNLRARKKRAIKKLTAAAERSSADRFNMFGGGPAKGRKS